MKRDEYKIFQRFVLNKNSQRQEKYISMGWRTMRLRLTYRTAKKLLSRMQSFCKHDYKQADKKNHSEGLKYI